MLALMDEITDKPEWDRKVFHTTIVDKWKNEALAQEDTDISEKMFDYVGDLSLFRSADCQLQRMTYLCTNEKCIQELRDKKAHFSETGRALVLESPKACVVKRQA